MLRFIISIKLKPKLQLHLKMPKECQLLTTNECRTSLIYLYQNLISASNSKSSRRRSLCLVRNFGHKKKTSFNERKKIIGALLKNEDALSSVSEGDHLKRSGHLQDNKSKIVSCNPGCFRVTLVKCGVSCQQHLKYL